MKDYSRNELITSFLYLHNDIKSKDEATDVITTLDEFRPDWQNLRNPYFERVYPTIFIVYGSACMRLGEYNKAIDILNEGAKELEQKDFKYFFMEKTHLYDLLLKCYIHNGNRDKAYEVALNRVYYELYSINSTHYDNFEFYGFRDFSDYSLADIANETISLCSPNLFNDPVDTAFFPWMHYQKEMAKNEEERIYLDTLDMAYQNIRVRCLVRNIPLPYKEGIDYPKQLYFQKEYANTVMWAHYANNHRGFCIKYCIPSSFTITEPEAGYILMMMPINYTERFSLINNVTFKDVLFTKQKLWKYEHEHRLLYFNKDGSPDFPTPKLPEGSIKSIYLGVKCSDENKIKILDVIKDKPDIEVYQMQISSDDIYKLKAAKINC